MNELVELYREFLKLKEDLFQGQMFVELDYADPRTARYNQLFQYFNAVYRTKEFESPCKTLFHTLKLKELAENYIILQERSGLFNAVKTVRVGDYVKHLNGTIDRVTYIWEQQGIAQTGGGGISYYLSKSGYVSYSGGLDPGVKIENLVYTGEVTPGWIWFFNRDFREANNSVTFQIDFRVYHEIEAQ